MAKAASKPAKKTAKNNRQQSSEAQNAPSLAPAQAQQHVTYTMSPGFVPFLARLDIAIALTSYQSGKFYFLGRNPKGGLIVDERIFQKAMGIYAEGNTLLLATLFQIHRFENILEKNQFVNETFDACYVPRISHTTGILDAHDIGLLESGEIIFVNTAYNCLALPSPRYSFVPVWKPSFISKIVAEDRCHLNGLAMENNKPRYVTAVSKSDTIDGWRDRRGNGGIVIDVESNEIVCTGLSMPHSPRMHNGKLWILNSGTGELGIVDMKQQKFEPVVFCPGFARGLSFRGKYAFVGLSKPRYERFEGLALDEKLRAADSEPWCGIQIIDLDSSSCVEWFRIDGAVAEIYDVATVAGTACPMSLGFASNEIRSLITHDTLHPLDFKA